MRISCNGACVFFWIAVVFLLLNSSCSTQRKVVAETSADRVVRTALSYEGTPYRYGGNDRRGLDCSGLVHLAIESEGIDFPRVSYQMAGEGKKVALDRIQHGDLLFFRTRKAKRKINHVGLVVRIEKGEIFFIHATTGMGVIVSSLEESYWKKAFRQARRVL